MPKVMIRKNESGAITFYVAKKDLEETVVSIEFEGPEKWGGEVELADHFLSGDKEIVRTLHEIILDTPDFTDQDLQEILTDVYGQAQQQKAENDLAEVVSKKEGKQQPKSQQQQSQPEENGYDLDWDDL